MSSFRSNRVNQKPYNRPPPRGNVNDQWIHDMADGSNMETDHTPRQRTPAGSSIPNTKLVVSNLHYEITPKDLISIFGQIGTLVTEPQIRYDRSGRSSGMAFVSYETTADAARAKKQFNGLLAKEQPMTVAFDATVPRIPRGRSSSAPTTSSLMSRIQKAPLLDRLGGSKDDSGINGKTSSTRSNVGPVRSRRGGVKPTTSKAKKPKAGPKTAEDLDKELDAFMGDGSEAQAAPIAQAQDVEMA